MSDTEYQIKKRIRFEPAHEVIYYSHLFIFINLAIIFSLDFKRVTIVATVSVLLTVLFIYFKIKSSIIITESSIDWRYFFGSKKNRISIQQIDSMTFYKRKLSITTKYKDTKNIYIAHKKLDQLYHDLNEKNPPYQMIDKREQKQEE